MKKLLPLLFIFISVPIAAQEPTDDPLADSYIIQAGGGNELVGINDVLSGLRHRYLLRVSNQIYEPLQKFLTIFR